MTNINKYYRYVKFYEDTVADKEVACIETLHKIENGPFMKTAKEWINHIEERMENRYGKFVYNCSIELFNEANQDRVYLLRNVRYLDQTQQHLCPLELNGEAVYLYSAYSSLEKEVYFEPEYIAQLNFWSYCSIDEKEAVIAFQKEQAKERKQKAYTKKAKAKRPGRNRLKLAAASGITSIICGLVFMWMINDVFYHPNQEKVAIGGIATALVSFGLLKSASKADEKWIKKVTQEVQNIK